jgi:WD40 repeat protein
VNAPSPGSAQASGPAGEVFLSYHSPDRAALLKIRELLATRGVGTFLDRDNLIAGMPWPQALEGALGHARAVAVFLGAHGVGLWQKREIGYALDRQVREEQSGSAFPVIPVLLPGTDPSPGFLFLNTWIDLRRDIGDPELIDALAKAIRGSAPAKTPETALELCPYRGFKPFTEEDRGVFFGREAYAARLLEATLRHRLVAVVGPSGSGKSSLVHAGLFPLLRAQHPPSATWDMASFVPTDQPFHQLAAALIGMLEPELGETDRIAQAKNLGDRLVSGEAPLEAVIARALAKSGGTDRLLLVVDQFEELFNKTDDAERGKFVGMLLRAVDRAPLTVLITLRASFHSHTLSSIPELRSRLEGAVVALEPMSREEMRRAVIEPARRVALEFERGLVERILDDLKDEPGNLALLEFALTRLWDKRQKRTLTHAAYEEIKSIKGAIAQRAEEFYLALSTPQQVQARRVFTRLWAPTGSDGRMGTRRRALTAELGHDYWPVIKALADARLLVTGSDPATGQDTVEIAHDALIHDWQRLKGWLAEDREFLVWRAKVLEVVADWEASGRDDSRLLRGPQIEEARRWREKRPDEVIPVITELIRHSSGFHERELMARVRVQRRLLIAAAASALAFLVFGALALVQWREVETQRAVLNSKEIASKALAQLGVDPDLAMTVAIRAFDSKSTLEAQDALRKALLESRVRAVLRGHTNVITSLALSADGLLAVTAGTDQSVRVWNTDTGKMIRELGGTGTQRVEFAPVQRLAFSPKGDRLLTVGADGVARIWDVGNGALRGKAAGPAGTVFAAAWISDEDAPLVLSDGPVGTLRTWSAVTGKESGAPMLHAGAIRAAVMSRDGRRIATGTNGAVRLWDPSGKLVAEAARAATEVRTLAFSPDGTVLAIGSADGSVRLWQTLSKSETLLGGHAGEVTRLVFSPDGRYLASAGEDNSVRVWDASGKRMLADLRGHSDTVDQLAFSADGRHLASAGADGLCVVWDIATGLPVSELHGHTDAITGVMFSPDTRSVEKRLITISRDRTARVWAAVTSQDWTVLRGHTGAVASLEFSPDGTHLLTAGGDNTARIWDLAMRKVERELRGHERSVLAARFSRNGHLVVTASRDGTARVWDAVSGKAVAVLAGHTDSVRDARFGSDGSRVVTASNDKTVRVWDSYTGKLRGAPLRGHTDRVYTAVFSPDGRLVATGSADRTARIWDLVTGGSWVLEGHKDGVRSLAFSPDGRLLATASDDGTARVWQVWGGRNVAVLRGHNDAVRTIEFSRDGKRILTASWDGTARIWEAPSFALKRTFMQQTTKLSAAVFSPDGKLVATSDWDATGHIWDATTGELVCGLSGHHDRVLGIAFSPDGKLVATASRDTTIRLWASDIRTAGDAYPCEACGPIDEVLDLAKKRVTRRLTAYEEQQFLGGAPDR